MACQRQRVGGLVKDLGSNAEPCVETCACVNPDTEALTWRVSLVIDLPLCPPPYIYPISCSREWRSGLELGKHVNAYARC